MSVVRGFGLNGQALYSNIAKPMEVNVQFAVTPTNGLGVTSVKSNGYVRNVFMHTSTTPASNNGYLNPNPANGYALIQLTNNFNKYIGLEAVLSTPTATSTKIDNSALVVGGAYVITVLGNATEAQWRTVGVPMGITPAVGVSFVAIATTAGTADTSTSRVELPTTSGIYSVEVVGDPNKSIAGSNIAQNGGAWLLVKFMAPTLTMASYTPAGTNDGASPPIFTGTPAVLTGSLAMAAAAPAAGSIVAMTLKFDGSTVTIDGI